MTVSFDSAAERLRARLSAPAFEHSVRVAEMARLLASLYCVDAGAARLAGLLHDWDRELTREELIAAAETGARDVEPSEHGVPYLLHARTGARAVGDEFPDLPQDVIDAIARHTLGAVEMSDLDMIVYVADMIEPLRDFEGVDALREAVGTVSLQDLFGQAYQQSVAHLVAARKTIHPVTVSVWNRYVARARP